MFRAPSLPRTTRSRPTSWQPLPVFLFFCLLGSESFFFLERVAQDSVLPPVLGRFPQKKRRPRPCTMASWQPPQVYWEPQEDLHCGRHAINMICGRRAFTKDDVDQTAREVDFLCGAGVASLEGFPGRASANYVPCATGGNWDADVLLKTLSSEPALSVASFSEQQMPPPEVYAMSYVGTLIHRAADFPRKPEIASAAATTSTDRVEASAGHYTCFRKVGALLYHLDSLDWTSAYCAVSLEDAQRRIQQPGVNSWHVCRDASPERPSRRPSLEHKTSRSATKKSPPPRAGAASARNRPRASPAQRTARRAQLHGDLESAESLNSSAPEPPVCSTPRHSPSRTNRRRAHSGAQPQTKIAPHPTAGPAATSHHTSATTDPGRSELKRAKTSDGARPETGSLPFSKFAAADLANLLRRLPLDVVRQSLAEALGPARPITPRPNVHQSTIPQDHAGSKPAPAPAPENALRRQPRATLRPRGEAKTGKLAPTKGGSTNNGERLQPPGTRLARSASHGAAGQTAKQPGVIAASRSARKPKRAEQDINLQKSKQCSGGWYGGDACVFSRVHPGQPARPRRNRLTCFWCSGLLAKGRLPGRTRGNYRKTFLAFPAHAKRRALARMAPRLREFFTARAPDDRSDRKKALPQALRPTPPLNTRDCPGPGDGSECVYSMTDSGEPALLRGTSRVCWWCSLAELPLSESQDGRTARPGPALNSAIRHVFNNFAPNVRRLARLAASPTVRSIIGDSQRKLCRGQRFDAPCEFSTVHPGCAVRVVRGNRCACCRADFARNLRAQRAFFRDVRRRIYRLLLPAYQSKFMQLVPAELRCEMALGNNIAAVAAAAEIRLKHPRPRGRACEDGKKEETQSPQNPPGEPRATQQESPEKPGSPRSGRGAKDKSSNEASGREDDADRGNDNRNANDDGDSEDDFDRDWQGAPGVGVREDEVGVREDELGVREDEGGVREDEVGLREAEEQMCEGGGDDGTPRVYGDGNRGGRTAPGQAPPASTQVWRRAPPRSPSRSQVRGLLAESQSTQSETTEDAEAQRIARTDLSGGPAPESVTATERAQSLRPEHAQTERPEGLRTNGSGSQNAPEKGDEAKEVARDQEEELDEEDVEDEHEDKHADAVEEEEDEEEDRQSSGEESGFPEPPQYLSSTPLPTQFDYEEWLRMRWNVHTPAEAKSAFGGTTQKERIRRRGATETTASSSRLLPIALSQGQLTRPPPASAALASRDAAASNSHVPVPQKRPTTAAAYDAAAPSEDPVPGETRRPKRLRRQ